MENENKATTMLSARQFAEGLLAGLAVANFREITASQLQLHKAFRHIQVIAKSQAMNVDFSDVDYDPLYGLSGWLDEFLARAQRDLMISAPNPSYGRIEINVTQDEGEHLLASYPNATLFKSLSETFANELRA